MPEYTTNSGLEYISEASRPDEAFDRNLDIIDKGPLGPVTEYGEGVTEFDPIFPSESDDKWYISDANDANKQKCVGLAEATKVIGADGYFYKTGAIVTNVAWNWALDKWIFVNDSKALSQTPGTVPIPVGFPIAPTKMIICTLRCEWQQTHIADMSTSYVDTDVDTAAEIAAIINLITADLNAIHARLEQAGINKTS